MEGSGSVSWQLRLDRFIENQEKLLSNNSSFEAESKLIKLYQTASVLDYQIEFELLSRRVTKMSELLLINFFISGLKPEIRGKLQLNRPTSLKEAFTSALAHGSRLEDLKLVMDEVDEELTSSELDINDTIVDEFVDSNVETEIVETLVTEVELKIHMPTTNSVLQVEVADEGQLTPLAAKVVVPTPLLIHGFEDVTPTSDPFRSVVLELIDFPQGSLLINGDGVGLVLHRRRVVFKFYMLEEIYWEFIVLLAPP